MQMNNEFVCFQRKLLTRDKVRIRRSPYELKILRKRLRFLRSSNIKFNRV